MTSGAGGRCAGSASTNKTTNRMVSAALINWRGDIVLPRWRDMRPHVPSRERAVFTRAADESPPDVVWRKQRLLIPSAAAPTTLILSTSAPTGLERRRGHRAHAEDFNDHFLVLRHVVMMTVRRLVDERACFHWGHLVRVVGIRLRTGRDVPRALNDRDVSPLIVKVRTAPRVGRPRDP